MEFLLHTETHLPSDWDDEQRLALRSAERERADELRTAGHLVRIWRVPGRRGSVQLWEVPDATVLDRELSSLPSWPWMDIQVEALARHPQEPEHG